MPREKLTPKQQRFVDEYLCDLNATQAAMRAGYSRDTANEQGSQLLVNLSIAQAVKEALDARAERTKITQDRVLQEIAILAFSNIEHYTMDSKGNISLSSKGNAENIRAVGSIKKREIVTRLGDTIYEAEMKLWDKTAALQMAGKHLGMFVDRIEQTFKLDLSQLTDDELDQYERIAAKLYSKS